MLARYGQQEEIVADQDCSEAQIKIRELSARKTQIKDMIAREKHKLRG